MTLARQLVELGHDCAVVTETIDSVGYDRLKSSTQAQFPVYRRPSKSIRFRLARWSSIVHSNGASVAMYPYAALARRPFMWTHNGYQIQCVDGLGWMGGAKTPMTPLASLRHTWKTDGLGRAAKETLKMAIRRFVTNRAVMNVACTKWVASRLNAPRLTVAYTPYDLSRFKPAKVSEHTLYDFIFVGRLVNEKGILDLLDAFATLKRDPRFQNSRLAIVGDGPIRSEIEDRIHELRIGVDVDLLGRKQGVELVEAMSRARVGVVPSRWEEPMGGVALELLASGRRLIVSAYGGIAECVEDVALTFPNGDSDALSHCMAMSITDTEFELNHRKKVDQAIDKFGERALTIGYVKLYSQVLNSTYSDLG